MEDADESCYCKDLISALESRISNMEELVEMVLRQLEREKKGSVSEKDAHSLEASSSIIDTVILGQPGMAPLLPLHEAAERGNTLALVRALLHGANPDALDQSGDTALHSAARCGIVLSVELLLSCGASVNAQDPCGATPLSIAVCRGHQNVVDVLLENGALLEQPDKEGRTPLMRAVVLRNVVMVTHLVRKGASVNVVDRIGGSPLVTAARDCLIDILNILIRDATPFLAHIIQAMMVAGSAAVLMTLIQSNPEASLCSDINAVMVRVSEAGWMRPLTAILKNCVDRKCHFEFHRRNLSNAVLVAKTSEILMLLWKHKDQMTRSAAMYRAVTMGWDAALETILLSWESIKSSSHCTEVEAALRVAVTPRSTWCLLRACPRVARSATGRSMVWRAAEFGWSQVLGLLINSGVSVNCKRADGSTPLHCAAARGHRECVEVLIHRGALTTVIDDDGWTPLHVAAEAGHQDVVTLLLENGADRKAKDPCGLTPCDVASNEYIVTLLR